MTQHANRNTTGPLNLPVVKLTKAGVSRVLDGCAGMLFRVDHFTTAIDGGKIAHVRDDRGFPDETEFQIWSLSPRHYEEIE